MAHCFVTRRLPGQALERLEAEHEVEVWSERRPPTHDDLIAHTRDAQGILTLLTDRVDAELLEQAPNLRAISNYAVGVDNVDLEAATERGIPVGHTPDVLTDATADLTFALMLATARKLQEATGAAKRGDWITWEPAMFLGESVYGATLGIVGFGRIGQAVAKRAQGFDMTILHTDSTPLNELLQRSDLVTLHVPLTPDTHHLIDAEALSLMRPNAILVNTARGQIVDQDALLEALHNNAIAAAALDVTDPEPLPPDHPLLKTPNALITPHIGSATRAARERMADLAVANLEAALAGRPMPHQANPLP